MYPATSLRLRATCLCRAEGFALCSWPSKSGLANKKPDRRAWSRRNSADQSCEVFISPVLKDPLEVRPPGPELVHCRGAWKGHRASHQAAKASAGREDDGHAPGETLKARLILSDGRWPYPHADLTHSNAQRNRAVVS